MKGAILSLLLLAGLAGAQGTAARDLAVFQRKLAHYSEMHQRLEGPLPPLRAASDMDDVHRLMAALRARLRAERKDQGQGYLLTPGMVDLLRSRALTTLTIEGIQDTAADIEEHTPAGMPAPRVNEALPEDAPFGLIPPQLLEALPPLPPELRYVILSRALVIWDHHADLVVDLAPGVFDAATYRRR